MAAALAQIAEQLTALLRAKTRDRGARAGSVAPLPGHAGFGYSFMLERSTEGGPSGALVLRLAPERVRAAGPADVVRQARIMESLANTGVPVPPILWCGAEPEFFGRPYFVARFIDGFKLPEVELPHEDAHKLARAAIDALVVLHRVPWEPRRAAWGEPKALGEEMERLDRLLDRPGLEQAAIRRAPELRRKLRASLPAAACAKCVHGDYQWSNIMFNRGRVVALLDWEIALVGPALLDLGWLCLFSDPDSWAGWELVSRAPVGPDEIVAWYSESAKVRVSMDQVRWFRAFSGYRFGVIAVFNLMLHRRGKRVDPEWERIALSTPRLFERGLELLG